MTERSELNRRVWSAVALGVPSVLVIAIGGWWLVALTTVVAFLLASEWRKLTAEDHPAAVLFAGICAVTPLAMFVFGLREALAVAAVATIVNLALSNWSRVGLAWGALGAVVAGLAPAYFVALRSTPEIGLELAVFVCAVVVVTDTGAYFCGKLIGGPRLAPRISPNKTWAGAIGALVLVLVAAMATVIFASYLEPIQLVVGAVVASIVAQFGDLAESALKRRFGVKDSGHLIPGHGGALDRLDSWVAVTLAVGVVLNLVDWVRG